MASGDILDDKGAATTHHNTINTLQVLKTIHILLQPEGQEHPPASASTLPPPDYNTAASLCECWKRATPTSSHAGVQADIVDSWLPQLSEKLGSANPGVK